MNDRTFERIEALFDTALFVILWAFVAAVSAHVPFLLELVH